ncbi:hypothetical protein ASF44_18250 [Pseudorhodoferax sp. Leaf274]|nr:hypothetical protein ASF44_18250 [Pseudorhodoferax sp. Leaf274]
MMLRVLPDNAGDTFVEIWIPKFAEISLSIRMPGTDVAVPVGRGDAKFHYEPMDHGQPKLPNVLHFAAIYAEEVAQGTEGTMILLAIGPTQARRIADGATARGLHGGRRRHVMARPGLWQLELRNLSARPIAVDAWIERADAPPDQQGSGRQAFFPESCAREMAVGNATPAGTLNGIATFEHDRAHVVGAMRRDGRLSDYSAAGKGRKPAQKEIDVVAPADWSNSIAGLQTMGFASGAVCRINGTSAASAVYARALAKHLDKQPTTLPLASTPPDLPPEIDCAPERQPVADPKLRGQQRRMLFPYEIDR